MRVFLPLVLVLCAWVATDAIVPGDEVLDSSRISVATDTLALVFPNDGAPVVGGLVVLETERQGDAFVRIERMLGAELQTVHTDSFVVDARTLAPIAQRETGEGVEDDSEQRFDGSAFYANQTDLVLAALPLVEGYAARVLFDDGERQVEVGALESVGVADGANCPAYPVRVSGGYGTGLYHVAADSRALVRFAPESGSFVIARLRACGDTPS